jgi:hypothetical protein
MHRAALLLACCACLGAQTAAIEGVVVNQATGRPMAGVHVRFLSMSSAAEGQPYGAISNVAGHFSIASLPAGTYSAEARQHGFFYMPPKGQGLVPRVSLKAGQHLADFKIEMAQGATISGRIIDDNGDPVQAGVRADAESERAVSFGRWANGDERGEFHMSVAPGKYYLVAEPGGRGMNQVPEIRTDGSVDAIYGETYYPSSAVKGKAVLVEAAAGAELTGLEIHLVRQVRGASIGGVVTGATDAAGGTTVMLLQGDDPRHMGLASGSGSDRDGHFLLTNLQPGTYRLLAWHRNDKTNLYSQPMDVHLEGADVTNLNLVLAPGGELTGKLEMPGSPGTEKLSVSLELLAFRSFGEPPPSAEADQSGAFRIANIAPGTYGVKVTPMPENGYLKSVRLDGVETPDDELDLSRVAQGSSLKIVVSRNGGQVSGRLLDKDGEPLGAMPAMVALVADPKEIKLDRSLKMAEDGTYRFQGIRPGKYRLLAFDEWGADVLEMVKKLAASAEEIEIKEGDRKVKDLKLVGKEDTDAKPSQ